MTRTIEGGRSARNAGIKFPLGGDVTQFIKALWEPFTSVMGQLGFININLGATRAPDLKNHIVNHVASYDSQIARIADALNVLVENQLAEKADLTVEQIAALVEFRDQLLDVRKAKEASRAGRVDIPT